MIRPSRPQYWILRMFAVPAEAPDRYTTMADLRSALCAATGVDPADIDPASGHDLSEAGYRKVRATWRTEEDRRWGMALWAKRRPDVMARVESET